MAKSEDYENLYLWTDSSCDHGYYAHHDFEKVAKFKSDEWKTDDTNTFYMLIYFAVYFYKENKLTETHQRYII